MTFTCLGLTLHWMVQVAVPQKVFQVIEHKRQDAHNAPLQDMGKLVGQEPFGHGDAPADENKRAPRPGPGPTGG